MADGKAFLVTESEILDAVALAACTPTVRAALVTAGGRPAIANSIGGRIVPLAPRRAVSSSRNGRASPPRRRGWTRPRSRPSRRGARRPIA